jgi:carboxymethylenebutenolidase
MHLYEGAGHAFANPSGTTYKEEAAATAWERTSAFLDRTLYQPLTEATSD